MDRNFKYFHGVEIIIPDRHGDEGSKYNDVPVPEVIEEKMVSGSLRFLILRFRRLHR